MDRMITVAHIPGCPNAAVLQDRLAAALAQYEGPLPQVTVEEITDPAEAERRRFHGSPALLVDGTDVFAGPDAPVGYTCRTYRTPAGVEGAPSVDQIVAVLAAGGGA